VICGTWCSAAGQASSVSSGVLTLRVPDPGRKLGGRLKLYCVDSYDAQSWSESGIPLEERALRHGRYESWITEQVVSWIREDCGGAAGVVTLGCSLGAFHEPYPAQGSSPPCSQAKASGTSWICGATMCRTTGPPGAPS